MSQATRRDLHQRLEAFVLHQAGDFSPLALALFAYQFEANTAYRRYCQRLGQSPAQISGWRQIPTVPTDVFRHLFLFCGARQEVTHTFRTSGTTDAQRGEHHLRSLSLYHTSARAQFHLLLPDGLARPSLILAPPPAALPDSSLSSMLGLLAEDYSDGDALFAWSEGALDLEAARRWLDEAQAREQPVQVLATSFALLFLLDAMGDRALRLPARSTLMTTGGTKGRTREISSAEIEALAAQKLGLDPLYMVHEYGMTELGSQFYDPRLARHLQGLPPLEGACFQGPPWCRVTLHDPATLAPVANGPGLLRFTDLSNLDSVCSVQTSDLGELVASGPEGDTLRLHGRLAGATPRGCSLMVEEAQQAQRRAQP